MAQQNYLFDGKANLDKQVEAYSEEVYDYFDYERASAKLPRFGKYYYPAMVISCCDKDRKYSMNSFARNPVTYAYKLTKMGDEMKCVFHLPSGFGLKALKDNSFERFSIGQCAEQHATNEMLYNIKKKERDYYDQFDVRNDVFFSKAIRPATGEVKTYCKNCKALFDL